MPKTPKEKVEEIIEIAEEICNEWEISFLESVKGQLDQGRVLTEKQEAKLDDLYDRACKSPY